MPSKQLPMLVAAALATLGLAAGCGGGDGEEAAPATTTAAGEGSGGAPATTIELVADPGGALVFDVTELEAPAGEVAIVLANDSPLPHDVSIEGDGIDLRGETFTGGTRTTVATLEPGTYTFYCSVPGHRAGGMEGTLTVK
ncbi:MAG: cupredoxin domain-containing protein [Thermoleophilia bacterium]|nr:cupredoxin domain-containing protein [Thermoleophilia bacterium]